MPTYEYRCKDCGHEFDIHQSFSEDSLTVCPECQGTLAKVFGNVGIAFKGSGFYKTDARTNSGGGKAAAAAPSTNSESSTSSSSSESSSTTTSTETKKVDKPAASTSAGSSSTGSSGG